MEDKKMSFNHVLGILIGLTLFPYVHNFRLQKNKTFAVKLDITVKESIIEVLNRYNFSLLYQITPDTLVIESTENTGRETDTLESLSLKYPDKILCWEQEIIYNNTIKPANVVDQGILKPQPDIVHVSENYFGMGVEDAWRQGFTGKGIVIAIVDVGINTDLLDLTKNVDINLSRNFIKDDGNVSPDRFPKNQLQPPDFTDHGNSVASIIAAGHGNNICSSGIAYDSTLAAFKVFEVKLEEEPVFVTSSEVIAKALTYKLNEIDIYVCAWSFVIPFKPLDLSTSEAIQYGAVKGRGNLGAIYVVPTGPVGNSLSNNINTITVGSIGPHGCEPYYAHIDASVITSGLSEGSNLTATSMVTASYGNKCDTSFKGLSAATAHIAGIIALGLEANPRLSLRDVLHLLVLSSEHERLNESASFRQNGVKRYFHSVFGYGLLNATKFVIFAANKKAQPKLLYAILQMKNHQPISPVTRTSEFCYDCPSVNKSACLTAVEHVVVFVNVTVCSRSLKIEVISPYGTESVLMDEQYKDLQSRRIQGHLVSTHFWDETSIGVWRVNIHHHNITDDIHVEMVNVTLYGTLKYKDEDLQTVTICAKKDATTETSYTIQTSYPVNTCRPVISSKSDRSVDDKIIFIMIIIDIVLGGIIFIILIILLVMCLKGRLRISVILHHVPVIYKYTWGEVIEVEEILARENTL